MEAPEDLDQCLVCGQHGHLARDCPEARGSREAEEDQPEAAQAEPDEEEPDEAGPDDRCLVCGQRGHPARDCPEGTAAGAGSDDAVDDPLEALEAWRREAEAAEAEAAMEAATKAVQEADRLTLASREQVEEAVEVDPGSMRLQGCFQGTATTHTHQLDLAMGLDLEMPSEVAAEAMKQLGGMSRGSSPMPLRLAAGSPRGSPPADQSRTMWNTLSDFFRKDANSAARQRSLPKVQLCLEDNSAERRQLASRLESTEGQAAMLEAQYLELQQERDELANQLELATQTQMEQAAHIEELQSQGERLLVGGDDLERQLDEREEEVRGLEAKLAEALAETETLRASLDEDKAARERLQATWSAECDRTGKIGEENASLRVEVAELRASLAGLEAKADALQQAALSPSKKELQAKESEEQLEALAVKLEERMVGLTSERDELRAQLGAAGAKADAAQADARELEARMAELIGQKAEAEARAKEAQRRTDESMGEADKLRVDAAQMASDVRRAAEKAKLTEQGHAADKRALKEQLAEEVLRTHEARREASDMAASLASGAKAKGSQTVLQKEVQGLREELNRQSAELYAERKAGSLAKDTLQDECKRQSDAAERARKESEAVMQELKQARLEHAAALATKAATDAQSRHSELHSARMERDRSELLAKVGALTALEQAREAEVHQLKAQLESVGAKDSKLGGAAAEKSLLQAEVKRLKALLAAEEAGSTQLRAKQIEAAKAAEASRSRAEQTTRRLEVLESRTAEQVSSAQRRIEAAEREAREAAGRAKEASAERDKARREAREARHGGLGDEVLRSPGGEELNILRRRCAALEAQVRAMGIGMAAPGGPILLQDNNGACLIRTINAMPTAVAAPPTLVTTAAPQPVPSGHSRSVPSGHSLTVTTAAPQPVPSGHSGLFPATAGSPIGGSFAPPARKASQPVPSGRSGIFPVSGGHSGVFPVSGGLSLSAPVGPGPAASDMPTKTPDGKRMSYVGTSINGVPVAGHGSPETASFAPEPTFAAASPVPSMSRPMGSPRTSLGPGQAPVIVSTLASPYMGTRTGLGGLQPRVSLASAAGQVKAKMNVQVIGVRRIRGK